MSSARRLIDLLRRVEFLRLHEQPLAIVEGAPKKLKNWASIRRSDG